MLKIGLVGCGVIGKEIVEESQINPNMECVACWDIDEKKMVEIGDMVAGKIPRFLVPEKMISEVDLIIEAANSAIVRKLLELTVDYDKKLLVASVGGLIGQDDLLKEVEKGRGELFVPSGALAGIDAIKSLPKDKIRICRLTTTKPPRGLIGAPFFEKYGIDLSKINEVKMLFDGTAKEAIPLFPKNINVAAALSLAGIGTERTRVRIFVDPVAGKNSHEIFVEGEFGSITTKTENLPSPHNPKTSYLAALSVVESMRKIISRIHIGT